MIAYIILGIVIFLAIAFVVYFKIKGHNVNEEDPFNSTFNYLQVIKPYMNNNESYFYTFCVEHLKGEMCIVPKVCITSLLRPLGNHGQYDVIKDKVVDFVVFDKKCQNALFVIDIVENTLDSSLRAFDKDLARAFEKLKLPVLTFEVQDFYVWEDIKSKFDKIIPEDKKQKLCK